MGNRDFLLAISSQFRLTPVENIPAIHRMVIEKMAEGYAAETEKMRFQQILSSKKCKIAKKNFQYFY